MAWAEARVWEGRVSKCSAENTGFELDRWWFESQCRHI